MLTQPPKYNIFYLFLLVDKLLHEWKYTYRNSIHCFAATINRHALILEMQAERKSHIQRIN